MTPRMCSFRPGPYGDETSPSRSSLSAHRRRCTIDWKSSGSVPPMSDDTITRGRPTAGEDAIPSKRERTAAPKDAEMNCRRESVPCCMREPPEEDAVGALMGTSVVVPGLQDIYVCVRHPIHQTRALGDAATPDVGADVAQGFRLPSPPERVAARGLDQLQDPPRNPAIVLDPVAEILER